jgi:hypothetical protein
MRLLSLSCILLALASIAGAQSSHVEPQVTATISENFVKKLADGNAVTNTITGNFYRDQDGRIRIERGTQVWIQDPIAGFNAVLDTNTRTARKLITPQRAAVAAASSSKQALPPPASGVNATQSTGVSGSPPAPVDLGKKVVAGYLSSGKQYTTTIPVGAVGNILPVVTTSEVWVADELHLPVSSKTSNSLNGDHTTLYGNIQVVTTTLDPSLFAIPPDYQVTATTMDLNAPLPHGLQRPAGK